jgi:hypothetical protein
LAGCRVTLGSVAYEVEKTVEKLRHLPLSAAVFEDLTFVLRNGSARPVLADYSS